MVLSLDLGLSDSKTQPSACGANAITDRVTAAAGQENKPGRVIIMYYLTKYYISTQHINSYTVTILRDL